MNVRDELKGNTVEQNQAIAKSMVKDFAVATFNLKGDLNLGSTIRTAQLTGAKDFFILNHRQWDRRSAVGSHNYINVEKHDECKDWNTTYKFLKSCGYSPIVVEHGGLKLKEWMKAARFFDSIFPPPCFIFGPEDNGFPSDFPRHLEIEQTGVTRSYNVASASAIVLYTWSFR
jgi:tRNA G18 (ribose-2'-O)-methylase SpoU